MSDKRLATKKIIDKVISNNKIPEKVMGQDAHAFGKTKIFFKVGVLAKIDSYRGEILSQYAIKLQALARGYAGRKFYSKLRDKFIASTIICDAVRDWITLGQWPWYKLFVRVKPMIPSDTELKLKKLKMEVDKIQSEIDILRKSVNELEELAEGHEHDKQKQIAFKDELSQHLTKLQSDIENFEQEKKRTQAKIEDLKKINFKSSRFR